MVQRRFQFLRRRRLRRFQPPDARPARLQRQRRGFVIAAANRVIFRGMKLAIFLMLAASCVLAGEQFPALPVRDRKAPSPDQPPAAPREFRAAWVATVANIDWPS